MASMMAVKVPTPNRSPEHVRHQVLAGSLDGTQGSLDTSCIQQLALSLELMTALQVTDGHRCVEGVAPGHLLPRGLLTSEETTPLRGPRKTAAASPPGLRSGSGAGRLAWRAAETSTGTSIVIKSSR